MKKIVALVVLGLVLVGCSPTTESVKQDQQLTDRQLQQYQAVQPVPFFNWSMTRQVLIDVFQAQNSARQTWAVFMSYTGTALFSCESVGFPVPADTQLTNPDQIAIYNPNGTSYDGVVGQMEPNGTYSSSNTSATYVLCIHNGKTTPVYWEPPVAAFPFEVKIVNGQIVDAGGQNSIEVNVNQPSSLPSPSPSPK